MTDRVPFTDIYVDDEIVDRAAGVLKSTQYVKGDRLEKFEAEFAEECGVEHAVGLHSGTAAILCGLQAAGISEGNQVFVPGHTFFATVSPVLSIDAEPVFVDVNPDTYTMDPNDLERKVERAENPQGIVPVHIYGQMADMEAIQAIADDHELVVVEDACQAHFAERDGYVAGTVGDVGAFSFYPSKNMTVGGDGGMLITDDDLIARQARTLRNHGRTEDGTHKMLGLNYRLDEFKAAVGRRQLEFVREWNETRNAAAQEYDRRLSSIPEVTTPTEAADSFHVYHLYVVQVPDRDDLREHLDENGIDTGIHYETPAHRHPAVRDRTGETKLERTERLCDRILSLPMHPRITDDEIDRVCTEIKEYYR